MKFKKKCFCMKLGGSFDLGAPETYVHPRYHAYCQLDGIHSLLKVELNQVVRIILAT